jgi:hypothetical protein
MFLAFQPYLMNSGISFTAPVHYMLVDPSSKNMLVDRDQVPKFIASTSAKART